MNHTTDIPRALPTPRHPGIAAAARLFLTSDDCSTLLLVLQAGWPDRPLAVELRPNRTYLLVHDEADPVGDGVLVSLEHVRTYADLEWRIMHASSAPTAAPPAAIGACASCGAEMELTAEDAADPATALCSECAEIA